MSVPLSHQCIRLLTCFPSTNSHLAVSMAISNHRKTLISRPMYVRSWLKQDPTDEVIPAASNSPVPVSSYQPNKVSAMMLMLMFVAI
jgi:hypothetical protein